MSKGYTPLFEFISPQNRIVLDYKETMLISIGIRHNKYGNYIKYEELKESCSTFDIHCVKNHVLGDNINQILKNIEKMEGIEGFVLKIEEDDTLYKIKCDWYRNLHKIGPKLTFGQIKEPQLWCYIMNNELDDLITILPKEDPLRKKLEDYAEILWIKINLESKNLEKIVTSAESKTKKYLSDYFGKLKLNEVQISTAKLIAKGEDPTLSLIEVLQKNLKNSKTIPSYVLQMLSMDRFVLDTQDKLKSTDKTKKLKEIKSNVTQTKTDLPNSNSIDDVVAFINGNSDLKKSKPNKKRRDRLKKQLIEKKEEKIPFEIKFKF